MRTKRDYLVVAMMVGLLAGLASAGFVSSNVYTADFEDPPFSDGANLADVAGERWGASTNGFAAVSNDNQYTGEQAAQFKSTNASGAYGWHTLQDYTSEQAYIECYLAAHWDWNSSNTREAWIRVQNADTSNPTDLQSAVPRVDLLSFKSEAGDKSIFAFDGGSMVDTGKDWQVMVWNDADTAQYYSKIRIELDMSASQTYQLWIDDDYIGEYDMNTSVSSMSRFMMYTLTGTDCGLCLDDLSYGNIPEPVTLAVLAIGGLAGLLRRRR